MSIPWTRTRALNHHSVHKTKSSADSEIKIPKINHSRIATTYAIVAVVVLDPEHEGPQQISQQGLFHPVASAV